MRRLVNLVFALTLVLTPLASGAPRVAANDANQIAAVAAIMDQMTPEEIVGQLFLVTFYGPTVESGGDIERLISRNHIGGVALLAANENITDAVDAPRQVLTLTNQLQSVAIAASRVARETFGDQPPEVALPPFIPLFIAINHEGDTVTEIRSGLTELPNAMTVGATWSIEQAEATGRIAGDELSVLGVNLLLGPGLDVLDLPRPQSQGDIGARSFGGEPFWVGLLGQAYIRGVHQGSLGRIGVIAKHLPGGYSSSDRDPEREVPTVRKSLEQLRQADLLPFFAVTGQAPTEDSTADGLLTSHIRFQGWQDSRLQSTRLFSLDPMALGQVLTLPSIAGWRQKGGLAVSSPLGIAAIRDFYGPLFNPRRIAQEAFNAGNDILFLSQFGATRSEHIGNIIATINFFTQSYRDDPLFKNKVDESVARILLLKLKLYQNAFSTDTVLRPEAGLLTIGQRADQIRQVAEAAATRLGSDSVQVPTASDRIVVFTDDRSLQQCAACPAFPLVAERDFEQAVLQLYGPQASGELTASNLTSFTFTELYSYLTGPPPPEPAEGTPAPDPSPVEAALNQADWIIFNMLDVRADIPATGVVSLFIKQRPELAQTKKVIVFALNAPYYLDSTELTKLTAYYALYSQGPQFIQTAARLLFDDLLISGASPVTISGLGYDITAVTRPNPNEPITISTEQSPELKLNDVLQLRTNVIRDHNGHVVPDGTPVRFLLQYQGDAYTPYLEVFTQSGVATIDFPLVRVGRLIISADTESASGSNTLLLNVEESISFGVTPITPTREPTDTPEPSPSATPPPSATPALEATALPPNSEADRRVEGRDFFMMFLGLVATLMMGYRLGARNGPESPLPTRGMRVALSGAIGLLLAYNYYALGLPGADSVRPAFGIWAATIWVMFGAVAGVLAGWYWFARRRPA